MKPYLELKHFLVLFLEDRLAVLEALLSEKEE